MMALGVALQSFRQVGFVIDGVGFTESTAKSIEESVFIVTWRSRWLGCPCMCADRILLQLFVGKFSLVDLAKHVTISAMINAHIL